MEANITSSVQETLSTILVEIPPKGINLAVRELVLTRSDTSCDKITVIVDKTSTDRFYAIKFHQRK